MDFFKALSVDEVKTQVKSVFQCLKPGCEEVPLFDSLDRVLCGDIISEVNVPHFNRSTVDGYAVKSSDILGSGEAVPVFLEISGEVLIGEKSDIIVSSGQAVYVPTGGMIPEGADCVVMIEHVNRIDENEIEVFKPSAGGENIICTGDDIKRGQKIYIRGKVINALDIGTLAAMGIARISVYKRLKYYIISTGDEIIEPGQKHEPGKIWDINSYTIGALIKKAGGELVNRTIVRDDPEILKKEIKKATDISDILLISGGSSVGTRDFTGEAINSFEGRGVFVHGILIKPGKPTIIGEIRNKAVFGLPGHPVSAVIIFKVFVEYLSRYLMGVKEDQMPIRAVLSSNVHSSPGSVTYKMVSIKEMNSRIYADIYYGKSGMITMLSKSCGYIVIKAHEEGLNKGEEVDVFRL